MICDTIKNLGKYSAYMPELKAVCSFLEKNDASKLEAGRHELENGIYVNVQDYSPTENSLFEAHRKYIDLQYIFSGDERIDCIPMSSALGATEYNAEGDYLTYSESSSTVENLFLGEGMFAIFEPDDPHRPGIHLNSSNVRKLIFKIPVKGNVL